MPVVFIFLTVTVMKVGAWGVCAKGAGALSDAREA
jgi:hypothetical protein